MFRRQKENESAYRRQAGGINERIRLRDDRYPKKRRRSARIERRPLQSRDFQEPQKDPWQQKDAAVPGQPAAVEEKNRQPEQDPGTPGAEEKMVQTVQSIEESGSSGDKRPNVVGDDGGSADKDYLQKKEGTVGGEFAQGKTGDSPVEIKKTKEGEKGNKKGRHSRRSSSDFRMRALILALSFLLPLLVMVVCMMAYGVEPFGEKSLMIIDALHQYMPFFSVLYDKLHGGSSFLYSFRAGLGINFLSLMAYYLISPLNLLILFFKRTQLNMALSMIMVLKIALSGLAMGIWCNARAKKPEPFTVAAAAAYALNSYMVGYSWNVMWLDAIMVLPLILLGIERLTEKNDGKLYVLALFYALACNYYIGYMICIFCVIWFFMQHFGSVTHFLKRGLSFAVCSLMAGGMAAVILIPAFLGIRQTAAGAGIDFPDQQMLTSLPDLLGRQITMNAPVTHDNDFDGNANLYVGIFVLVFLILYILNRNIRLSDKIRRLLVIGFFYLSFCEIRLNFIWHGFHDQYGIPNRFSFLLGFLLISMAFDLMGEADQVKSWHIPLAIAGSLAIFWVSRMFAANLPEDNVYIVAIILALIYSLILLLITLVCRQKKPAVTEGACPPEAEEKTSGIPKRPPGKLITYFHKDGLVVLKLVVTLLVIVEMSATAILGYHENGQISVPKFFRYTEDMEEAIRKQDDGSFYRSEVVHALMLDEAIYYPMNTVGLFGSTASGRMVDVMDHLGFSTGANEYKYVGENVLTDYLLNVRYQYYKDTDEPSTAFRYKDSFGQINVFENPWKTSGGYMVYPSIDDYFEEGSVYPFRSMNMLAEDAFGQSDLFMDIEIEDPMTNACSAEATGSPGEYRFYYEDGRDDNLTFNIPIPEGAEDLCFYYDGTQVSDTFLSLNGKDLIQGDLDGQVIDCGKAEPGSWLIVTMRLKGDDDSGIVRLSAADCHKEVMDRIAAGQEEKGFEVTGFTDRSIEGKAKISGTDTGRNLLFLSIPYDKGWKLKVDGESRKAEAIGEAFLGVELEPGEHDISLIYTPPGYQLGLLLSLLSIVFFILLCILLPMWWRRHRDKRSGKHED